MNTLQKTCKTKIYHLPSAQHIRPRTALPQLDATRARLFAQSPADDSDVVVAGASDVEVGLGIGLCRLVEPVTRDRAAPDREARVGRQLRAYFTQDLLERREGRIVRQAERTVDLQRFSSK